MQHPATRSATFVRSGALTLALLVAAACSSADPVATPDPTSAVTPAPSTAPTTAAPTTTIPTTTVPAPTTTAPTTTPYVVPLADPGSAGWNPTHSGYPATDLFISCGAEIVSPVNGVALEIRTVDSWDSAVDDPATRGGRSVAVLGDDGVRYYVAHLDEVDPVLVAGERVAIGQRLGTVGRTGRTSACHVHFGISPPCPGPEWSVRRGVIGPARYLDAWRAGEQLSPAPEVQQWSADNPTACADALAG
jgi:murein DD-endopeptidase MepM/ murein hydrolase activator NlpD